MFFAVNLPVEFYVVDIMKKRWFIAAILPAVILVSSAYGGEFPSGHPKTDVCDGWQFGIQAWTFHKDTFFDAVDKIRFLGLGWMQIYPNQKLAPDIDAALSYGAIPAERKQLVDEYLARSGVTLTSLFSWGLPKDEKAARSIFAFAKEMGMGIIAAMPEEDQLDMLDKLCVEYDIKLAIHNYPKPRAWWNPDMLLQAFQGRSERIGACADVGHWVRSGLDPVECLKKLEGRIFDIHMKETYKEKETDFGADIVFGTGRDYTRQILEELHRQGWKGVFSVEHETNPENNLGDLLQCVAYYNKIASTLNPSGWRELFELDLANAHFMPRTWSLVDGELELKGGGDIWTKAEYDDFILDFDFCLGAGANSGVFLRTGTREWLPWIEVQIADSAGMPVSRHICGAIFDVQAPAVNAMLPAGEWNRMTIWARGPSVRVMLNAKPVIDISLDDWKAPHKNPDGTANKFSVAYKDLPRRGFIGFQDHGDGRAVTYRNVKIRCINH